MSKDTRIHGPRIPDSRITRDYRFYESDNNGDRGAASSGTGLKPRRVKVNYLFDGGVTDPDQLLDRYFTLDRLERSAAPRRQPHGLSWQRFNGTRIARNGVGLHLPSRGDSGDGGGVSPDVAHVNASNFPFGPEFLRRRARPNAAPCRPEPTAMAGDRRARCFVSPARATRGRASHPFRRTRGRRMVERADFIRARPTGYQVMRSVTGLDAEASRAAARPRHGVLGFTAVLWSGRLKPNKESVDR